MTTLATPIAASSPPAANAAAPAPGSGQELGGDADADEVVALAVEGSQRHAGSGEHGQDAAGGVGSVRALLITALASACARFQVVGSRVAVAAQPQSCHICRRLVSAAQSKGLIDLPSLKSYPIDMQATPLWVTITGFVLGPAVLAAFLTYIFNRSLNKQKSSLDEVVQERLNEQKASLDKSVQSSLNEQKASLDEAVQRRLSEYAAARQDEHHRAERRRLLARRYLYQLGEAVDSLWYRVDNWANRGGAGWSESRHPGYWEVTSLYVVARALGAERVLALEGVHVDLHELSSDKDPKLPERAVEEAVKNAFEPGLFYYHRLALAEAVLDRPGDEFRLLIYSEFLRRYENPEWNLQSLLEPARQAFGSLNIKRLETLKQSLAGLSECIKKLMT